MLGFGWNRVSGRTDRMVIILDWGTFYGDNSRLGYLLWGKFWIGVPSLGILYDLFYGYNSRLGYIAGTYTCYGRILDWGTFFGEYYTISWQPREWRANIFTSEVNVGVRAAAVWPKLHPAHTDPFPFECAPGDVIVWVVGTIFARLSVAATTGVILQLDLSFSHWRMNALKDECMQLHIK